MRVALATADVPIKDQDDAALTEALAGHGHDVGRPAWDDDSVDWAGFDVVVIRSTWNYVDQRDRYVAWAEHVEAAGVPLFNPAAIVRWNTHKGYLIELEERGVPIVPTAWLGRGDRVSLAELAASRRWDGVVCKPAIGAGSSGLLVAEGDLADAQPALDALLATRDAMVQPLQRRVRDLGELSVVCIDGRVSHAVRKRPAPGDLRIGVEFGGTYTAEDLDDATVDLCEWIVASTGHDLLYARVDLLPGEDGTWQLGELEATEPSLYLDRVEGAADRLAAAIVARMAGDGC